MAAAGEHVPSILNGRELSQLGKIEESLQTKEISPSEQEPPVVEFDVAAAMAKVPIIPHDCGDVTPGFCTLPSLVGYKNHDISKWKAPAFTIGVKRVGILTYEETPGPIYETTGLTRYGKASSPRATVKSRPPLQSVYADEIGPGPDRYAPEKNYHAIFRRTPGATVKGRKYDFIEAEVPGPKYDAERVIGPKLPVKASAPRATISRRAPETSVYAEAGPGPGHYNPGPIYINMLRTPSAKISFRWPCQSVYDSEAVPAPNAYFPNYIGRRAPTAFMGIKHSRCKAPNAAEVDTFSLIDY